MKRYVVTIDAEDSVQHAAQRMRDANVGILPVIHPDGHVVGVVTDRDLAVRVCSEALPLSTPAAYVMTSGVISCRPDDTTAQAMALMREHRITRILLVDENGILAGVLSLSDLVFYEPSARMGRTLRAVAERKYESGP